MSTPLGPLPACLYECRDLASPDGTAARSPWSHPRALPRSFSPFPVRPSPATRSLAEEVISIARSELPGLNARIGYLDGDDAEYPTLATVLAHNAAERVARFEQAVAAGREVAEPTGPSAVVVPLLAGRTAR